MVTVSPPVSPSDVASILMIQKPKVMAGTFASPSLSVSRIDISDCRRSGAEFCEQRQGERHGHSAADTRGHLSIGHHVHPLRCRQDCDVARAALARTTCSHDTRLDRMNVDQPPNEK